MFAVLVRVSRAGSGRSASVGFLSAHRAGSRVWPERRATALRCCPDRLGRIHPGHGLELANWARRGWVRSRRTHEHHLWILWAGESELIRRRELAASSHRGIVKYPAELITPKRLG